MKKKKIFRDLGILLVIFLAIWIYFIYNPVVDSKVVKTSYLEKETEIKNKLIEFMNYKAAGSDTTELMKALSEIQFLVQDKNVNYELYYSNSEEINAFALPGNLIVINRGIIKQCESPEELIGVLTHEVGHLKEGHISEQIITSLGIALLFSTDASTTSEVSQILAQSAFSRDMETEADDYAIKKMQELEISPYYMSKLFKRLYTKSDVIPEFLSTHPGMHKRISKFSKFKDTFPQRKYEFDWTKVKNGL